MSTQATLVQYKKGSGFGSASATLAVSPTVGNVMIAVAYANEPNSGRTLVMSGFTKAVGADSTSQGLIGIFYREVLGGDSATQTVTISPSTGNGATIELMEFSNLDLTDLVETTISATGGGSPKTAGTTPATVNQFTLAISGVGVNIGGAGVGSWSNGFTAVETVNNGGGNLSQHTGYKNINVAGAVQTSATWTGGGSASQGAIAVFNIVPPPPEPLIETTTPTLVRADTVQLNGEIQSVGDSDITKRGFVYDLATQSAPGAVAPASSGYASDLNETGTFTAIETYFLEATGLATNTTYFARAYAQNTQGYGYGSEFSFTTDDYGVVIVDSFTNLTLRATRGNGSITDDGDDTVSEFGFVYDLASQSAPADVAPSSSGYAFSKTKAGAFGVESLFADMAVMNNTTYFARAYIRNSAGYSYSAESTFSSLNKKPEIYAVTPGGALLDASVAVTITGDFFLAGATVKIDGELCADIVVNSDSITCTAPIRSAILSADLVIENTDGQKATAKFYYVEEVPSTPQPLSVSANFEVTGVRYRQ